MPTNTKTSPALKEASRRRKENRAQLLHPARRMYENGRSLKDIGGALGVDSTTVKKWATQHGWKRGVPE